MNRILPFIVAFLFLPESALSHEATADIARHTHRSLQRRLRSTIIDERRRTNQETVAASTENMKDEQQNNEDTASDAPQSTTRGLVDLVHLVPFDVQIAVTENLGIQTHEVNNVVTQWMNQAYIEQLKAFGFTEENKYAEFDSVVLFDNGDSSTANNNQRGLQQQQQSNGAGELFTAKFRGGAVFSRDETRTQSVPPNDVLLIQQMTLLNDTSLAALLQSSTVLGLGSSVVDVNAFLTPKASTDQEANQSNKPAPESDLEIVIVAAIAVACVAFLFLLGAVIWAYRYDRANRQTFLVKEHKLDQLEGAPGSPDRTDSDTVNNEQESPERIHAVHVERQSGLPLHTYPTVIGGEENDIGYPESVISDSIVSGSVISEDISTSLSQYYRSGMGKMSSSDYGMGGGLLSDAGSVSSMESYGYSLDLDGGMSAAPLPSDAPYKKDRERIGGLPVEPDDLDEEAMQNEDTANMEDVQIPDLDKELANLDIQLSPNMEPIDVESYSQQDLEQYQMQDLEEMEALQRPTSSHKEALAVSLMSRPMPVDVDDPNVSGVDDDDDDADHTDDDDEPEEKVKSAPTEMKQN